MRELKVTSHEIKLIPVPKLSGGWSHLILKSPQIPKSGPSLSLTGLRSP
jgi:hypothetical protein